MNIAHLIDHTILKPDATDADLLRLAGECVRLGFFSACANSRWVPLLAKTLEGTGVAITSIAGFPSTLR